MKPYYEGWYLKQQQGDDLLAVIPGRALPAIPLTCPFR